MASSSAVRPPQQERTRRTWLRILDVGLELLEQRGFDGLTIAELCERAGVTPPTIYARAPGKESLLAALYEHALERVSQADTLDPDDSRWRELPADAVLRDAVGVLARIWLGNAALMRAIVRHSSSDAETFRRGREASVDFARRFRAVLAGRVISGPDAERRADACFRIVYAALVQRVTFGERFDSDLPLDDEQLELVLVEMVRAYLRSSQGRAS